MLTPEELQYSPLFQGITYDQYQSMCRCFQAVTRSYQPGKLVCNLTADNGDTVGIVERGAASLIRIDANGVSTVLEDLTAGGVFGQPLTVSGSPRDILEVVCRTACDVLFIDYPYIVKRCQHACTHHSILVQNMLQLIGDKARALSERVDVLSRRSIREKLLCCFAQEAEKSGGSTFTLPFSYTTLAEYIAVDRSAMMRELKHMRESGEVATVGREVTLQPANRTARGKQ